MGVSSELSTSQIGTSEIVWRPDQSYLERSRLKRFIETLGLASYDELLVWALADPARFWNAVLLDLDLQFYRAHTVTLDISAGLPWARWFVDGLYNYAHDAVDKRVGGVDSAKTRNSLGGRGGADACLELRGVARRGESSRERTSNPWSAKGRPGRCLLADDSGSRDHYFWPALKLGAIYYTHFFRDTAHLL